MTKRAYLTPKQRLAMFYDQGGRCKVCGEIMNLAKCIGEHWHPVALGNTSKPDCLLCVSCADRKTNGTKATTYGSDKHAIAKDKRLRGVTKQGPKKKIPAHANPWPPKREGRRWPKRRVDGSPVVEDR